MLLCHSTRSSSHQSSGHFPGTLSTTKPRTHKGKEVWCVSRAVNPPHTQDGSEHLCQALRSPQSCPRISYLDAHVGVVDVHLGPQVFADPLLPQELFQELGAVLEVVPTDSPLPGLAILQAWGVVAGAALHAPGAARPRQRVRQGRRGHGVQEGCFLKTCTGEGFGTWERQERHLPASPACPGVKPEHNN